MTFPSIQHRAGMVVDRIEQHFEGRNFTVRNHENVKWEIAEFGESCYRDGESAGMVKVAKSDAEFTALYRAAKELDTALNGAHPVGSIITKIQRAFRALQIIGVLDAIAKIEDEEATK